MTPKCSSSIFPFCFPECGYNGWGFNNPQGLYFDLKLKACAKILEQSQRRSLCLMPEESLMPLYSPHTKFALFSDFSMKQNKLCMLRSLQFLVFFNIHEIKFIFYVNILKYP